MPVHNPKPKAKIVLTFRARGLIQGMWEAAYQAGLCEDTTATLLAKRTALEEYVSALEKKGSKAR
jgi:hypothetical protein